MTDNKSGVVDRREMGELEDSVL